jgi:rubredoxin
MKTRTCPKCGYKSSLKENFQHTLFRTVDYNWHCDKCGVLLSFSFYRWIVLMIISILPLPILIINADYISAKLLLSKGLIYVMIVLIVWIWTMFIQTHTAYSLIKTKDK